MTGDARSAPFHHSAPEWRALLARHQLDTFDALWSHDAEDVDEPNRRGDGWSRVGRLTLDDEHGHAHVLFVKRQEEWWIKDLPRSHFACVAEARNLARMKAAGIPVPECAFVEMRKVAGRCRGILVTAAIPGSTLDAALAAHDEPRMLIKQVANAVLAMHRSGWRHRSLYPKHVLVEDDAVAFIDVERSRHWPLVPNRWFRDLDSLNRRTRASRTDRLRFLLAYAGGSRVNRRIARRWRRLARRFDSRS